MALEELNKDLSHARNKVEKWSAAKVAAAADLKRQHVTSIEESRGESMLVFWHRTKRCISEASENGVLVQSAWPS